MCSHSFLPSSVPEKGKSQSSESPGEIQSLLGANTVSREGQAEPGRGRHRRSRPYRLAGCRPVCQKDKAM